MTMAGIRTPHLAPREDFPRAREIVALELNFHAAEQRGDSWRGHTPAHHARHAFVHFFWALIFPLIGRRRDVGEHLAHGCCRAQMALEVFIQNARLHGGRLTCARAFPPRTTTNRGRFTQ